MPSVIDPSQGYQLADIFGNAYQTGMQMKARKEERERQARLDAQAKTEREDKAKSNKTRFEAIRSARKGDYAMLDEIDPELALKYRGDVRADEAHKLEALKSARLPPEQQQKLDQAQAVAGFEAEQQLAKSGQPGMVVDIAGETLGGGGQRSPIAVPPDVIGARSAAEAVGAKIEAPTAMDLRGKLEGSPEFRAAQEVKVARDKVLGAPADAVGDMSLIYGIMKLQDPGNAVKEGELAMAEQAKGVDGKIMSLYNRVIKGERLSTEQRAQFKSEGERLYGIQRSNLEPKLDSYRRLALTEGIDPASAGLDIFAERQQAAQQRPEMVSTIHGAPGGPQGQAAAIANQVAAPAAGLGGQPVAVPPQDAPRPQTRPQRREPENKPAPMKPIAPERAANAGRAYEAMVAKGATPSQALQNLVKSGAISKEQAARMRVRLMGQATAAGAD